MSTQLQLGDAAAATLEEGVEWNEQVCRVLGDLLQINPNLRRLTLRGFSFIEAQSFIATGLQYSHLEYLEWHQNEMDPGSLGEVLESCRHSSCLQSILLIDCDLGLDLDAMDHPFTLLLTNNTQLHTLRVLECDLSNCEIQAMACGLQHNQTLQVLDLRGNAISDTAGPALANLLQQNTSLSKLILEDNDIGNAGLQTICQGLQESNASLDKLNLRGNRFSDYYQPLALLSHTIRVLDLSENQVGKDGAVVLGELLSHNSCPLEHLILESTQLDSDGIAELVSQLQYNNNTSLLSLHLGQNVMDVRSANAVARMLQRNATLQSLNLSSCHIDDETVAALVMPALSHSSTLTKLYLGFNNIGNDGCKAISNILPQAQLTTLEIQFNAFDTVGLGHLVDGLSRNVHLTDLFVLSATTAFGCERQAVGYDERISYWLNLNRAGRRALRQENDIHLALWPTILERADDPTAVFYFLQNKPDLVQRRDSKPCKKNGDPSDPWCNTKRRATKTVPLSKGGQGIRRQRLLSITNSAFKSNIAG